MKARRGVTLIELMIVMSACTTVLTISVVFMARVLRAQREATAALEVQRVGWRLSTQFRVDVHRAVVRLPAAGDADLAAAASKEGTRLVLLRLADDSLVEYRQHTGVVIRHYQRAGQLVQRDEYRFPEHAVASVDEEPAAPRRLVLTVNTPRPTDRTSTTDGTSAASTRNEPVKPMGPRRHALPPAWFRFEAVLGCEPCPLEMSRPDNSEERS